MKLSIIIPVYNEERNIMNILEKIDSVKLSVEKEIVIVDDFSIDGTIELLKNIESKSGIKVIYHIKNSGKGTAVRTALEYISGDMVIIQDADMEYDPNDYPKLIEPIIEGKAEVIYGSRNINKHNRQSYSRYFWGGKLISLMTNLLYRSNISDEPTGYKVFKASLLKGLGLKCKRFEFCPEVTARILKKGINIQEVPINYTPRKFSEGKKIRWHDGFEAIWTLVKYRFID